MAPKQKPPEKFKSPNPESAPTKATQAVTALATQEPSAADAVSKEEAVVVASTVTIVASPASKNFGREDEAAFEFDVRDLQFKTLDFWADNAFAILDYATELSKATSVADVVDLQSRFSRERISKFSEQLNEGAEVARRLAMGAAVSIRQGAGSFAI
jgi:hypothetical protein